jgi:hypothetical protein
MQIITEVSEDLAKQLKQNTIIRAIDVSYNQAHLRRINSAI